MTTLYLSQTTRARSGCVFADLDGKEHIGVWWITERGKPQEGDTIRVHLFDGKGGFVLPMPELAAEGLTAVEIST